MDPPENQTPTPKQTSPRRSGAFSLGRAVGIPVFVDYSWLLIFFLVTLTISQDFAESHPNWAPAHHWVAGVLTSILFFASVFLHEMGHCLLARSFGIPVASITLFIFGGVAHVREEPRQPWQEFLIAIAGPVTSVALAAVFGLLSLVTASGDPKNPTMLHSVCFWLAGINLSLAIFNMVPGFPLDGGRVLRSLMWTASGRFEWATRVAASIGSFIAYFFIAVGIYLAFFHQSFVNGLWIAFIGWFLLTAARSSVAQLATRRAFTSLTVVDAMEQLPLRVSPAMSVQALVDGPVLQHGLVTFIVEDQSILRGMVTLQEVKATPREEWPNTPLQSIMIPANDLVVVEPHVSLQAVMDAMDERGVSQMPVVEDDRVVGIVTREALLRIVRNQLEFGTR